MNFLLLILRTMGRIPCIASYCHTGRIGMMQRAIQAGVQVAILTITPLSPLFFLSFFFAYSRAVARYFQPRTQACSRYPIFPTSLTGDVTSEIPEDDWERGCAISCGTRATPRQNALRMSTSFNIRSAFYLRSSI